MMSFQRCKHVTNIINHMPQNCYIIQKINFALVKNMFYLKNVEKEYIID